MRGDFGVISQCVATDSEEKLVSSKFVLVRDAIALGEISLFQHTLSNAVVIVALLAPHPLRLVIFDWLVAIVVSRFDHVSLRSCG